MFVKRMAQNAFKKLRTQTRTFCKIGRILEYGEDGIIDNPYVFWSFVKSENTSSRLNLCK